MTIALCLILDCIVELVKGRLGSKMKILALHDSSLRFHLGKWRMLGTVTG